MDPERIRTVAECPFPSLSSISKYFWDSLISTDCFIEGYLRVVLPYHPSVAQRSTFCLIYRSPSILSINSNLSSHPSLFFIISIPELPTTVHADSSRFAISGIVSQPDAASILHPIAFWSRKCIPAECRTISTTEKCSPLSNTSSTGVTISKDLSILSMFTQITRILKSSCLRKS